LSSASFSPQKLLAKIRTLPESGHYWIAYSGGMDSHAMLYAFHEIRHSINANITAVHIDHGINQNSGDWADHCRRICTDLGIELVVRGLRGHCPRGESVESWARSCRYEIFNECVNPGGMLCTAHHCDDQAETLLLQLFRGGGPRGLSAMPEIRRFGSGWLARPLLEFSRDSIREYALIRDLAWIEDDMNADQNYDRSFLRHTILTELRVRWPNISGVLSRVSSHQAEAAILLDELAAYDMAAHSLPNPDTLSLHGFQYLSPPRCRNLIRYWIRARGLQVPDSRTLQQILSEVVVSRTDAQPCVPWHGMEIRRYRQVLCLVTRSDNDGELDAQLWNLSTPFSTPLGKLQAVFCRGRGIRAAAVPGGQLSIRYRRGGETIRPAGRGHLHSLKKLLQEQHVPPWLRSRIPLLYMNNDLVAVAGFWIDSSFHATADEDAWEITWEGVEKVTLKISLKFED